MFKQFIMQVGIIIVTCSSFAYANPDAIVIPNGDVRIKGPGSGLVFPDGSIQYKATVEGPVGPQGAKGDTGAAGANGFNSLVLITDEGSGANCSNGGLMVQVGLDLSMDSILDGNEITQTKFICANSLPSVLVKPAITSIDNTAFTIGTTSTFTVTATGNPSPTLSLSGTLPSGITFNASTGVLSGTPATGTVGSYPITIIASNGVLPNATSTFILTVAAPMVWTISVPATGQTISYAPGDDGALKKGLAWLNPRFTDNTDGTVTDNLTTLVWAKDAGAGGKRSWQAALDYVKSLNSSNYMGYSDWRLPNFNELKSLINLEVFFPALTPGHPFINIPPSVQYMYNYYWSSTSNSSSALAVGLDLGNLYNNGYSKVNFSGIWPVRGGDWSITTAHSIVAKTGQTTCSDYNGTIISCAGTGQDGEIQKGMAPPSPRFSDLGDGTSADGLTGLIWTIDANGPGPSVCVPSVGRSWQDALTFVSCLNANNYLNHNDWRLPNLNELISLHDMQHSVNKFKNVQTYYWTSSTYAYNTTNAWRVDIHGGNSSGFSKTTNSYIWPVRSRQ